MTTKFLLILNVVAFCRHSVLVVYEYLQPGDMLWNGKVTLNICMRKVFLNFIATFATRILTCWYTMV